jgi:diamine N-acetyltransferase
MMSVENNEITLRKITEETLWGILKLEVKEHQGKFVASNAVSIAEAYFSNYAWFRGIYYGDKPVGFVMLYLDKIKPEYYLWRFMIAKQHQGKGLGSAAMQLIIQYVKGLPNARELVTSYVPGEASPAPFYKKLGFYETGEWDEDEKVMKLDLISWVETK